MTIAGYLPNHLAHYDLNVRQIVVLERDAVAEWLDPSIPAKPVIKLLGAGKLAVQLIG